MKLTNSWLYFEVNELHGRTGFFARHRFAHAQITLFAKLVVGRANPRLKQLSGAGKSMIDSSVASCYEQIIFYYTLKPVSLGGICHHLPHS